MAGKAEKPPHVSQADWDSVDVPDMTETEFAEAKPFADLAPSFYAAWKRAQTCSAVEIPKVLVNFRLAADLVERIKASGLGYDDRVEKAIREAFAEGRF